jgi:hypothetical protein
MDPVDDAAETYARAEPNDAWDMTPGLQMCREVSRHGTPIRRDQKITVAFQPHQNIRIECPCRWRLSIPNRQHLDLAVQAAQLTLDGSIDMLIQKKSGFHDFAGPAGVSERRSWRSRATRSRSERINAEGCCWDC